MRKTAKSVGGKIAYLGAIGLSTLLLVFFIGSVWIGYEAKSLCQNAVWQYGGDCVEALIVQLEDEHQSYVARNHAIWALGQMGDTRALPVLNKFYTGVVPEREPLNEMISQYELKKAIELVQGGINITSVFWRGR